jgi:hypothetical protein
VLRQYITLNSSRKHGLDVPLTVGVPNARYMSAAYGQTEECAASDAVWGHLQHTITLHGVRGELLLG